MSIIGILKIMEVQEDDMEVQEEAVSHLREKRKKKEPKAQVTMRSNASFNHVHSLFFF